MILRTVCWGSVKVESRISVVVVICSSLLVVVTKLGGWTSTTVVVTTDGGGIETEVVVKVTKTSA